MNGRFRAAIGRDALVLPPAMEPLARQPLLDEAALWTALQALLSRLATPTTSADEFLDALADVLGADRAMLLLTWGEGETLPLHGRREGRALSNAERVEITRTLIADAERTGRCVQMSAFDDDGTSSAQAYGILAAFAVPLENGVLAGAEAEGGARRGVLYVDFRDRTHLPSPRVSEFLAAAAALLSSVVAQGQRLELARESLRKERARAERVAGVTLEQLLSSAALAPIARQARAALMSDAPILLTGESGTGKTLLAQLIAEASGRTPIIRATVGSSDDLNTITSELFGHEKGSFSGALARRPGLVEYADGGTIIFDELLNLPRAAQQLLLDFTQFGTYRPLGWSRAEPRRSRARLICATNGDIEHAVAQGGFREDLFYRVAGHRLDLPPLRDRLDELPRLAREYVDRVDPARRWTISPALLTWLKAPGNQWKGNFRQLEATLRRAMDMALSESRDADLIDVGHLSEPAARELATTVSTVDAPAAPPLGWSELQARRDALDAQERDVLKATLARAGGVVSKAARELGIPRTSLLSRLASLGLGRE